MATLTIPTAATANATGEATFTFPSVSLGFYWTLSVMVPLAPASAVLVFQENGRPLFTWLGGNASSSVQVTEGTTVSIAATGLVPNTQYQAIARGAIMAGTAPGQPVSSLAAFTSVTASTVKVSIVNYLPVTASALLTVRVKCLGLSTPVQLPAFVTKIGVSLGWTPTNKGKRIYVGGTNVTTNSAAINTSVPPMTWQIGQADILWVLGTTGDYVNVIGE